MTSGLLIYLAQAVIYLILAMYTRLIAQGKFPKDPQKRESFRSNYPVVKNKMLMNFLALIAVGLFLWTLWKAFGSQLSQVL